MKGLRGITTGIALLAIGACDPACAGNAPLLNPVNQFARFPTTTSVLASPALCQAETSTIEAPAADSERKQYIRQVLAKSKLAGKRLDRSASGFFVAANGTLLTTASVVEPCAAVSVSPMYGEIVLAEVVAIEDDAGIALLRVDIASPGVATLISSGGAFKRSPVYMLGYPVLGSITTEPALAPIRVLNSQQTVLNVSTMLIEGDVRSGYGGGPILDSGGGVIGILTLGKTQFYGSTDAPLDSTGLAAPSEILEKILEKSDVAYRTALQLPLKPADRILVDSRPFAAQVGCWQ